MNKQEKQATSRGFGRHGIGHQIKRESGTAAWISEDAFMAATNLCRSTREPLIGSDRDTYPVSPVDELEIASSLAHALTGAILVAAASPTRRPRPTTKYYCSFHAPILKIDS